MKTNNTINRYLALVDHRDDNAPNHYPKSIMVAPVNDRTSFSVSSAQRPLYQASNIMRTTSISKAPTHDNDWDDDLFSPTAAHRFANINAHVHHIPKHPGLYDYTPGTRRSPNRHGPSTKITPPKPRRLNFNTKSADPKVPTVAAPFDFIHDTPTPRRSTPKTPAPPRKRSFPFNHLSRTPAERSPTFKRDVWDRFDSHGRSDFRQRLAKNFDNIGNHLAHRPMVKAKRPTPLVCNKFNSTNRYNRSSTISSVNDQ